MFKTIGRCLREYKSAAILTVLFITGEAIIEAKLKEANITWYKQTDFLNDEKLFQTTYESEVFING